MWQRRALMSKRVAVTAAALERLKRHQKSAQRRLDYQKNLVHKICFVLFVMNSPSPTLALAYADHARGQGKFVENITAESLQEEYLQTSVEDLADIMAGDTINPKVLRTARRFEQEQRLHGWIRIQNVEKGVAPSSARIVLEANRMELQHESDRKRQHGAGSQAATKKWVQRYQKRWRLKKGKFPPGESMPQEEAKAKVQGSEN